MVVVDPIVSSLFIPFPSERVVEGSITPFSNATTLGASIDTCALSTVYMGLSRGLMQNAGLILQRTLLFIHIPSFLAPL